MEVWGLLLVCQSALEEANLHSRGGVLKSRKVRYPAFGPDHPQIDPCVPKHLLVLGTELIVSAPWGPGDHRERMRREGAAHRQDHPESCAKGGKAGESSGEPAG